MAACGCLGELLAARTHLTTCTATLWMMNRCCWESHSDKVALA